MTWATLLDIIEAEAGPELARRIEARARQELGGARITISVRALLRLDTLEPTTASRPKDAAKALGVHPSTVYRALHRRIVR